MDKDKCITIIGKLNEFIFNLNYIIVYKDGIAIERYYNKIKNNLSEYLNKCKFFNKFEPILDEEFHNVIIGSILKYDSNDNNENNHISYNKNISVNKIDQYIDQQKRRINNYFDKYNDNKLVEENNNLKQQLNDEKSKNSNLCEQIKLLKLELIKEKNKNKMVEKMEKKLKMELENEIKKYKDLTEEISNNIKNDNIILSKDKEIEELKIKLSRYPFELKEGEEIMNIYFKSIDNKINYSLICKNTDIFHDIIKKFPNDKEYESINFYTSNGIKICEYKSIKENNIKNNDVIILK